MRQGKVVVLPMIIVAVLLIVSFVVGLFIFKPTDENKSIFDYFVLKYTLAI